MLTTLEKRNVETFGVQETNQFTIKANGKAFKVLIDRLYSNKILAVIRELWSNALDSHIAAGCAERPFDCQLPTRWEPQFRVRDYGTSLSHEGVMRLYTTVFESTKDGDNSQVGQLGLGSKSPFAYTDTFTVTAWKDGEKRIYSAYIGEDHIPRISHMLSEPTEEPTGLEISFPTQMSDFHDFEQNARAVARGFNVLPTFIGNELEIVRTEPSLQGPGWKLERGGSQAHAKQGCVVYPIDARAIPGITGTQAQVLTAPFFIEFPIGALEIAASREGLGYDASTCKNILAEVDRITAEVRTEFQARVQAAQTYLEALTLYADLHANQPEAVRKIITDGVLWRGRKMRLSIDLAPILYRARKTNDVQFAFPSTYELAKSNRVNLKFESSYAANTRVKPSTTLIYVEDTTKSNKSAGARIRYHYQSMIRGRVDIDDVIWVRLHKADSHTFKRFLAILGRPARLIDPMSLPKPPSQAKAKGPVPLRVVPKEGVRQTKDWDMTEVESTDDVIFVHCAKGEQVRGTPYNAHRALNALIDMGVLDAGTQIVGIPSSRAKLISENPHWQDLWALVDETAANHYSPRASSKRAQCRALGYSNTAISMFVQEIPAAHRHGAIKRIGRVLDLADAYLANNKGDDAVNTLVELCSGLIRVETKYTLDLDKLVAKVFERYPLLAPLARTHDLNDDLQKAAIDYVSLVDAREQNRHVVTQSNIVDIAA